MSPVLAESSPFRAGSVNYPQKLKQGLAAKGRGFIPPVRLDIGDAEALGGMASHVALVTQSMTREHLFNADGELLIVAQENGLVLRTEFGLIEIKPGEVCVIPRGVIFRVELTGGPARAYVCENYGAAFTLPDRGPIGANSCCNSSAAGANRLVLAGKNRFELPAAAR